MGVRRPTDNLPGRCARLIAALAVLLALGCGAARPPEPVDVPEPGDPCPAIPRDHAVFAILIDEVDVGREVRSHRTEDGPLGPEQVYLSHEVLRMKMGAVEFERHTIRSERLLASDGTLLRGSHVSKDQVSVRVALVGFDGQGWGRLVEKRELLTDPTLSDPEVLQLSGDELIGYRLVDHLREIATGRADPTRAVPYYEPLLDIPVQIEFAEPRPGSTELDRQTIDGTWVAAIRKDTGEVVLRALFDSTGTLWEERYPQLQQIRRRIPGPLSLTAETSSLLVGLRSETYLGLPNSATRAVFRLHANPDRIETLAALGEPHNQTLSQIAPDELRLEVSAGAPDGDDPPTEQDLGSSLYIKPDAPEIRGALRYLRSAGRRGRLEEIRRDNATAVIAQADLIRKPGAFWRNADKVAGLVMRYVYALLPDKRHTFSMADAVSTLSSGAGDCTEHSVLFASLMRAQGIPTRLVAGLYLTRGGLWGYHMWAAYWNGTAWLSIDPGNAVYRPGALYVALGRGVSQFSDLREDIGKFIDRTFTGVGFDLIEASNNGEQLTLARPRIPGQHLPETAIFNAIVLSGRGDHLGALELIDGAIPPDRRSLRVKLQRIELMVLAGQHDKALDEIVDLRSETSSTANTYLLDTLEIDALLATGRHQDAAAVLERLTETIGDDAKTLALYRARFLFGTGEEDRAIEVISEAIDGRGSDSDLQTVLADYIARRSSAPTAEMLATALEASKAALVETMSGDHRALAAMARILIRGGRTAEAIQLLEHALILAPDDLELLKLREETISDRCIER